MRTRSQARKRRQQQVRQTSVESPNLEKPNNNQETFNPPIVTMDDNRTMAQLLEAPTEGYEDAIVVPEINARGHTVCPNNRDLKDMHSQDAVLRNMKNQGQILPSQMANLTDIASKFDTANTASIPAAG
ncbi:hypothetical protein Tco_0016093 [Tanacetum coccineum]